MSHKGLVSKIQADLSCSELLFDSVLSVSLHFKHDHRKQEIPLCGALGQGKILESL